MAVSILLSAFDYPDTVPRELAEIAAKAMSRDAAARFASADELRLRLESYLRHRGSLALSDEAMRRLAEMRAVASDAVDEEGRARLYQLSAEARFGFRQAIIAYDRNEAARAGLRATVEALVEFELARGTAEGAAAALAELDAPPPELASKVRDALAKREAEKKRVAELEMIGAELDPSVGRRTRMSATAILGVIWTIAPELLGWLHREMPDASPRTMYGFTVAISAIGYGVFLWGRESLTKTVVNRRIIATGMLLFATQLLLEIGCTLLGIPFATTLVLHLFVWSVMATIVTVFIDRKLWPTTGVMMAAFLYAAARPEHVFHAMSLADFVLLVNAVVAWSNLEEDTAYTKRRRDERAARRGRSQ
jgi:serine/threonine-protein kinase